MVKKLGEKNIIRDNWLLLLIAAQPALDALAYWTQGGDATAAGYIRLAIMLILPCHLLFTLKKKRAFVLSMLVIGVFCVLHILNGFRVGYVSFAFDAAYMARIAQMPVLTVCFICYIKDEAMKEQVMKGFGWAAIINLAILACAVLSGTYTPTYDGGIGISGWVIDDNRCANSIIFVSLSAFAVYKASVSDKKWVNVLLPVLVALILIVNGTTACYLGLFVIFGGFAAFGIFRYYVCGEKFKKLFTFVLLLLVVLSVLVYPYTPRHEAAAREARAAGALQNELELRISELGYDPASLSFEDKFNTPEIKAIFEEFYYNNINYIIPDMFEKFGMDKVLIKYGMTTDAEKIIDVRVMKISYASLIWDECDSLTKLVGFETKLSCGDGKYDMENDWHAVFFYCGYLGFGLYVAFALWFIWRVVRKLLRDFKGSLNMTNCWLLISYVLLLGLAHFSGAALRRPNVSVYLSLIMALIYYQTELKPRSHSAETENA